MTLLALYLEKKLNTVFHGRFILALATDAAIVTALAEHFGG